MRESIICILAVLLLVIVYAIVSRIVIYRAMSFNNLLLYQLIKPGDDEETVCTLMGTPKEILFFDDTKTYVYKTGKDHVKVVFQNGGVLRVDAIINKPQEDNMSRICPLTNDIVLYPECTECDDKEACRKGELDKEDESDNDFGTKE